MVDVAVFFQREEKNVHKLKKAADSASNALSVSNNLIEKRKGLNHLISHEKSVIPHGLVARMCRFHRQGRGSIPRGGVNLFNFFVYFSSQVAKQNKLHQEEKGF